MCCTFVAAHFLFILMKQDGRKNNAGQPRKPKELIKKPITIYETAEDIALLGGLDAVRAMLKTATAVAIVDRQMALNQHRALTDPMPSAYENSKPGL